MSKLSLCGFIDANTGLKKCGITRGKPTNIFAGSAEFDSGDYASEETLRAAFSGKIKQAKGTTDKLFPLGNLITGVASKRTEAKTFTFGNGIVIETTRAKPGYEFTVESDADLDVQLMKFHNKRLPLYIYDENNALWGKKATDGTVSGVEYIVNVTPGEFATDGEPSLTKITISAVNSRDFTENACVAVVDFGSGDLEGLVEFALAKVSNSTNVYKYSAKNSNVDILNPYSVGPTYGTEIAALTFTATSGATTTPVTSLAITTVTYNAAEDVFVVTYDSTAYSAVTSGHYIKLTPPTPAVMTAADVDGVELISVMVTK